MSVLDTEVIRLADAVLVPPFPGPDAPGWVLDALSGGLAGVTLFGSNVGSGSDRLREMTAAMRAASPDALIAIDEEGGDVTRLWYSTGSPYPGNAALGAVDDVELTSEVYAAIGTDLASLGVNMNLAPCLDVLAEPGNPVVGTRSFGMNPDLVARHGAAAVRGLQASGIAACVKHFPGHGATLTDTHTSLAVVTGGLEAVRERDLPPFQAAIEAGVLAVMPGHLVVPGLTGSLPASLSADAIALARSMGFTGVVISDALEMHAVSDPFGIPGAAVLAVAAGNDLLCLGRDVSEEGYLAVRDALVAAVGDGTLPGARLEEAAYRVAALRAALAGGLTLTGGPALAGGPARTGAAPGSVSAGSASASSASVGSSSVGGSGPVGSGTELGLRAARRALRFTGARPALTHPVVVEVEPQLNIAAGAFHWGLSSWLPGDSLRRVSPYDDGAAARILKGADGRDLVLVFRDAHRSEAIQALVTAVLAERKDAVLVEMGLPIWQPEEATTYLATYGASRACAEATAELLGLTPA